MHKRYVVNVRAINFSQSTVKESKSCKMFKFICILLATCVTISNACKCVGRTNDQKFCDSQFAGVIKITSAAKPCGPSTMSICYGISIKQQIRGASSSAIKLQVPSDVSAACGLSLTVGEKYFITGAVVNANRIGSNSCEIHDELTSRDEMDEAIRYYQSLKCRRM